MRKVLNVRFIAVLGALVAGAIVFAGQDRAQARLKYFVGFGKKYPNLKSTAKKVKCNICHFGKTKKNRNDYGKALMKNIKKDEKVAEKIAAALGKTEAAKNAKGVTFGSLIRDGKLPGKNP